MINGINKDGFAYVLYINGGHQQWMILYPFKQKPIFKYEYFNLFYIIKFKYINMKIYLVHY